MEQEVRPSSLPSVTPAPPRRLRKRTFSILFLILAALLTAYGLHVMHTYESADKIVGGDAYNFIILASRGTGWICAGIVSGLFAAVLALFDLADKAADKR